MSTNSTIAVSLHDGRIKQVYCHYDGYLAHNGQMLVKHYNSQELAEQLVSLGDMSALRESIDCPPGHSFETPAKGCTIFYGRDRKETGCDPVIFDDFEIYKRLVCREEYNYIFIDNEWKLLKGTTLYNVASIAFDSK